MSQLPHFTFQRYLAAKRTVDDRALNQHVWHALHRALADGIPTPLTILEIGGGIGTMPQRLFTEDRLPDSVYHLVDERLDNIDYAAAYLIAAGASTLDAPAHLHPAPTASLQLTTPAGRRHQVHLYAADYADFIATAPIIPSVNLLIAHAFLDLLDIQSAVPALARPMQPRTLFYFTINFDGVTLFQPDIDFAFDTRVETLYHRTMDERVTNGKLSGDSRAGRRLFHLLNKTGIQVLDAGSSDWVVLPQAGHYPDDEAYFLHFIVHTVESALAGHPELDAQTFHRWIAQRHRQITDGTLFYIAHQLDYLGVKR
jgi:hypothetical protein